MTIAALVPATASAKDNWLSFDSMQSACYEQYSGTIWMSGGPAFDYRGTWYCTNRFNPVGGYLGGIDIQRYCSRHWPGSRAVYRGWGPYSWFCRL